MDLADGLGLINSGIQYAGAQIGAVKDKKWIAKENQKARDFQVEMWNKANEYNMPSAVMQRYIDAGLNPNLIYDNGAKAGMADLASAPGHSAPNMGSKDISKYGNIFQGYAQVKQLEMQQDLVKSQISLNESAESKNIAQAEESRSKIGSNISNKHLIDSITEGNKLSNAFNELTFQVRNEIVQFDAALKEQDIALVRSQIRNIDASTDNNNKLTDMRMTVMSEGLAMAWQRLEMDKKELAGRLELWAKEGNAAVLQAKAAWLNALTNSNEFNLEKDKFEKFSPKQLELLEANVSKLNTFNGWYDSILEMQTRFMGKRYEHVSKQNTKLDLQNTYFDMNLFMPLLDW